MSGKTTLALHLVAEAQREGGIVAFIDAEHALDPEYARNLGVDIDSLLVSQPATGEEALEIADGLVRSGAMALIVVDSVAALVPKAEIEGEMGDSHMGLQARMMSQAMRKLSGNLAKTNCAIIFINQIRGEDRRHVRQPGDHARRTRPQILRLGPPGSAPRGDAEAGDGHGRQPHQGESRQEQGRPAVPPGRVRHHVRQGHLAFGRNSGHGH